MQDIAIIGGGHVGLYTAMRLAELGYQVTLFEQKASIGEKIVCTGIISPEAFQRFDLPAETVMGQIRKVRFYSPSMEHFDYDPEITLAQVVDRPKFNQYFAEKAALLGAKIETGRRVDSLHTKREKITLRITGRNGFELRDFKMIVISTGVNFKLAKYLNIPVPDCFLGGAQVHIPFSFNDQISIYLGREIAQGSFGWCVPVPNGTARVGVLSEKNALTSLKRLLDCVKPGWRDDVPESNIDVRPVIQSPVQKSFAERVLLVGEAAGQIKTTTGGGIYYGLLGAEAAVDVIREAFKRGNFTTSLLSKYDTRWKKIIFEEIKMGYYCRKIFSKLSDEQIENIFERLTYDEILNVAHKEAKFDWHRNLLLALFKVPNIRTFIQKAF